MYKALVDGDVIVYRAGFSVERTSYDLTVQGERSPRASFRRQSEMKKWAEEVLGDKSYTFLRTKEVAPEEFAYANVKRILGRIKEQLATEDLLVILSGRGNFRMDINPEYKANRKDAAKPYHYQNIRTYLKDRWAAIECDGIECDDYLGIESRRLHEEQIPHVICSIDKDLNQLPGWHYNFVKDDLYEITETEGNRNFYKQCLTGDMVDNVQGLSGVGPVGALSIIGEFTHPTELYRQSLSAYLERDKTEEEFRVAATQLWILRKPLPEGMWTPPVR